MAKELIFYSDIYNGSVKTAVESLQQIDKDEDVLIRLNSGGGSVTAGFSFLSVLSERTGSVNAVIDGQAASMAAFWLPFFSNVVANDTSTIMFHKAAFSSWYTPSAEEQAELDKTNKLFEKKMRAKVVDSDEGEEFLGKLFEKGKRNDITISAAKAKRLGLVSKVKTLKPSAFSGMQMVAMVEENSEIVTLKEPVASTQEDKEVIKTSKLNKNSMEITPEMQAKIDAAREEGKQEGIVLGKSEGLKEGAEAEQARQADWKCYEKIDPVAVAAGIASGKAVTNQDIAGFMEAAQKGAAVSAHAEDNTEDNAPTAGKSPEEIEAAAQQAEFDKLIGNEETNA